MDKRILIVIIPALLFALVFLDSYNSPILTTFGGSPEIEADKYHYSQFDFETGEYIELEYTVQVTSGPPIDIFLVDPPNFERYRRDQPFEYIEALSSLGAMDVEISGTLREHDTYYLVLDNTNAGMIPLTGGVAFVEYELTYRIQESGGIFADFCSLFFLIITVAALVAYLIIIRSEKKKRPLPPPPPGPYLAQGDQFSPQGQQTQLSQPPRERPPPPPPDYTGPT